ncbi:MAG: Alpha-galactosidase, partial [Bacteroidetes bacterium]|nr:Alpha-galactosidase [Bacteroidota bacterium]
EKIGISGKFIVRDVWRQKDICRIETKADELKLKVPAHGVALYKFIAAK